MQLAGVVTNLAAGMMGARWGIKSTLLTGLSLQLVGIGMLFGWQVSWVLCGGGGMQKQNARAKGPRVRQPIPPRAGLPCKAGCLARRPPLMQDDWSKLQAMLYVTATQLMCGIAKDLTKLGGKTVTKLVTPGAAAWAPDTACTPGLRSLPAKRLRGHRAQRRSRHRCSAWCRSSRAGRTASRALATSWALPPWLLSELHPPGRGKCRVQVVCAPGAAILATKRLLRRHPLLCSSPCSLRFPSLPPQCSYYMSLGILCGLILAAMPWAITGLSNQLGRARKENVTFGSLFK